MIVFTKIRMKNFFSVGENWLEINYLQSPTTLVSGTNGSGKSSCILDSWMFALFGRPFRKINKPQIVNHMSDKNCVVELWFEDENNKYHILRGMKPNLFEIYCNDVLIPQDAASRDYQKDVLEKEILGFNERAARQVIILGSSNYLPFMDLPASSRRAVVEDLLDATVFSVMKQKLSLRSDLLKENVKKIQHIIAVEQGKLKVSKEHQSTSKAEISLRIENLKNEAKSISEKLNNNQKEFDENKQKLEVLLEKTHDMNQIIERKERFQSIKTEIKTNKNKITNSIKFFQDNDVCPTCSQDIGTDHKCNIIENNSKKLEHFISSISSIDKKLEEINNKAEEINKFFSKINDIKSKQSSLLVHINNDKNRIKKIYDSIALEIANKKKNSIVDNITEIENAIKDGKKSLLEMAKQRDLYETAALLLKDSGIKTKIIRSYLTTMNKLLNEYLQQFGLPYIFTLNEEFEETIRHRSETGLSYNSLSQGEKQRINIAIMLTWRHVAFSRNSISTNLLILDEILDSSLDSDSLSELINMFHNMGNKTNIFVISHRIENQEKFSNGLNFVKQNGVTKIDNSKE